MKISRGMYHKVHFAICNNMLSGGLTSDFYLYFYIRKCESAFPGHMKKRVAYA